MYSSICLPFLVFAFDLADESIRFEHNRTDCRTLSRQNPHPGGNMKYTGSQTAYWDSKYQNYSAFKLF